MAVIMRRKQKNREFKVEKGFSVQPETLCAQNTWEESTIALRTEEGKRVATFKFYPTATCEAEPPPPPSHSPVPRRMSSISFPNGSHYGMSSIHSNAEDEDGPYHSTSGFDTTHGIQMNPHSPHPPRTPRTSTAYSTGYDPSAPSPKRISATLDTEPEEERVHDHPAQGRVKNEEVWREVVKSSDGRDKAFARRVFVSPWISF